MHIKEVVPKFCVVFAETALELMNRKARKNVEKKITLVSDATLTQVSSVGSRKETDDGMRKLDVLRGKEFARYSFTGEIEKIVSDSLVSLVMLYKKDALAVLRR